MINNIKKESLNSHWSENRILKTLKKIKNMWQKIEKIDFSTTLLVDIPEYSFLKWKDYSGLKKITWNIKIKDLLWEWYNWIAINHPKKKDRIIKIAKPNTFDLYEEALTHSLFKRKIEKLKKQRVISNKIQVPYIEVSWDPLYYVMEKIEWQNFTTKFYYEHYKEELSWYNPSHLQSMSDYGIKVLLRDAWNIVVQCSEEFDNHINQTLLDKKYEWWWNKQKEGLGIWNVLQILEEEGYTHWDAHGWNIMQDINWDYFLIDFWTSEVENSEFI